MCGHASHRRGGRPTRTPSSPGICSDGLTATPKLVLSASGASSPAARQVSGELALDRPLAHEAERAHVALDEGVTLLHDPQFAGRIEQAPDLRHRQRIHADAQHVVRVERGPERFLQIIPRHAAREDARAALAGEREHIGRVRLGVIVEGGLLVEELGVGAPRIRRNQRVPAVIGDVCGLVLRPSWRERDAGAAVRETGDEAQQHRDLQPFGQLEGLAGEVVALLLVGRLEAGNLREVREIARVLLVLRAVHRRVVGDGDDEPAVRARDRDIHERVGGDVEPDVLHRDQCALAGVGDAYALLQRDLLVGRPQAADGEARPLRVGLDGLEDLRRRRSRIRVGGADAGVDRPSRNGLVSQQYFVRHGILMTTAQSSGRRSHGFSNAAPRRPKRAVSGRPATA